MEDDLIFFCQKGNDLTFFINGRQPNLFWKKEDDLNLQQIEDDLNIVANGSSPRPHRDHQNKVPYQTLLDFMYSLATLV